MDISGVVAHLQQYSTIFNSISGAATPEQAETLINTALPSAVIVDLGSHATDEQNLTGVYQNYTDSFMVVVALSNVLSRTGIDATLVAYSDVFVALNSCFLGWRPDARSTKGFYLVSATTLEQDGARAYYSFQYAQDCILTETDGWANNQIYLNAPGTIEDVELLANIAVTIDGGDITAMAVIQSLFPSDYTP